MPSTEETFNKAVQVTLELEPEKAEALAQFVKRVGFQEILDNAVDENEAYAMKYAIGKLQDALSDVGYSPR